ncbi:MAG: transposase, partial [Anaerolineales bacterium]|nr:transposase [Anaerolineales bacterium]
GESSWSGRITRHGRRDLRRALVEAAQAAVRAHDHWGSIYKRLSKRMHKKKALIAVARKLLVAIWHVLTKREVDRYADEEQIACGFFRMAYKIGPQNLPDGMSAKQYTRHCLDILGIGKELTEIPWGSKRHTLPPSRPG